jgi:hypothetical protein
MMGPVEHGCAEEVGHDVRGVLALEVLVEGKECFVTGSTSGITLAA